MTKNVYSAKIEFKKVIAVFAMISFVYFYVKYSGPDIRPLQSPTEAQLKEFYEVSGIKQNPLVKIIHFEKQVDERRGPDVSYQVVSIFESSKIDQIEKLSQNSLEIEWPPPFIKQLDLPKNDNKKFVFYHTMSPGATGVNLRLTTSNQGQFSYGYYELVILRNEMKY